MKYNSSFHNNTCLKLKGLNYQVCRLTALLVVFDSFSSHTHTVVDTWKAAFLIEMATCLLYCFIYIIDVHFWLSLFYPLFQRLIRVCGEVQAAPTETEEIQFLCTVCAKLKDDPYLVNFFIEVSISHF